MLVFTSLAVAKANRVSTLIHLSNLDPRSYVESAKRFENVHLSFSPSMVNVPRTRGFKKPQRWEVEGPAWLERHQQ